MFSRCMPLAIVRTRHERPAVQKGHRLRADRHSIGRPGRRARLRVEGMEDRCLLSITEFPVPTAGANPFGITVGPDGNVWFTENYISPANKVGMINPTTHTVTDFAVPTPNTLPFGITAGPDGNVWFTEHDNNDTQVGRIGEINPVTHAIAEFPLPSGTQSGPAGIVAGPDGNLWFAEQRAYKIGMINPNTHVITE